LILRAIPEGPKSRAKDSAVRPSQIDKASESCVPDSGMARPDGQQTTAQNGTITTPTHPVTRQTGSITVKEEAPEIYLLPSEPPLASSSQTDAISSCHFENPPQTAHSFGNMANTETQPPSSSIILQSLNSYNAGAPISLVTAPPSTNPAFESPDALSNIATCFLDRCV
jgi:hypothetical protein